MEKEKLYGIIQIIFAIAVICLVLSFSNDIEKLAVYGYTGVFIISLLSSATIFLPAPGWIAVVALSRVLNPLYVGLIAGVGSGIGEITGYLAGNGLTSIVEHKNFKKIKETIQKYDLIGIFILSFIPNPLFDLAGIAAGGLKIKWWRFLIACIAGRVLRYLLLAYIGSFSTQFL